ncbi:hypothetical protein VIGAN_07157600 [Vigna angularis var. angularis]|uniref:Protein kinase domain-containing protein n=1 Tax=Vigna angularis var. angularis TaxID=157739 RepID=A0A0S3SIV9_PHAAN|nr:hypothetical protein VIGAN_07157600 [Vigna angularis var. angularis]
MGIVFHLVEIFSFAPCSPLVLLFSPLIQKIKTLIMGNSCRKPVAHVSSTSFFEEEGDGFQRKNRDDVGYNQLLKAEVNYLSQLHHENLVKLIGYYSDGKNRLLVYEFMHKGSLENHLFRKGVQPIPWTIRINIAVAVARGLTFLHTLDRNVIYRDLKAANILLIRYLTLKVWLVNL